MANELTYESYMEELGRRISKLESMLSDLQKTERLFKEHPELFSEFKRMTQLY